MNMKFSFIVRCDLRLPTKYFIMNLSKQQTTSLSASRVNPAYQFENCDVDYAGPAFVRSKYGNKGLDQCLCMFVYWGSAFRISIECYIGSFHGCFHCKKGNSSKNNFRQWDTFCWYGYDLEGSYEKGIIS